MNDTTLVFVEACAECGRVTRISPDRQPRRRIRPLCEECSEARRRERTAAEAAENGLRQP